MSFQPATRHSSAPAKPPEPNVTPQSQADDSGGALRVLTHNAFLFDETEPNTKDPETLYDQYTRVIKGGVVNRFFSTPDFQARALGIADLVMSRQPDVAGFEEIWQRKGFEIINDRLTDEYEGIYFSDLGARTDLAFFFKKGKFQVISKQFFSNRWQGSDEVECAKYTVLSTLFGMGVVTLMSEEGPVRFALIHPMHQRKEEMGFHQDGPQFEPERGSQHLEYALKLAEMEAQDGIPTVMMGDFNCSDQHKICGMLQPLGFTGTEALLAGQSTFSGTNPYNILNGEPDQGAIDHIKADGNFQITEARVLFPWKDFSDHQPVEALLKRNPVCMGAIEAPIQSIVGSLGPEALPRWENYFRHLQFHSSCYVLSEMSGITVKPQVEDILDFLKTVQDETTPHYAAHP